MLKQAESNLNVNRFADAAFAISRQVWLAGLGAAAMTRDWARNDAGHVFRALVKEGSTVEAKAARVVGHRVESSIALATTAWNRARNTARSTVSTLIESAAAALPAAKPTVPARHARTAPAKKQRATKARAPRKARRSKRPA
jgi:poly(hydroxyalkanoate) granule associated protein phasin